MVALIIAVAALWLVAGVLWLADGSKARPSVDAILADRSEPITLDDVRQREGMQQVA
ncbi:hypothetical protein AAEX63_07655 [Luteococcus sp. H138]|uniref:hypothetical protein n=1 Tax=unclassified Luteococcus TaxID=2639923 RepID=UPI00313AE562